MNTKELHTTHATEAEAEAAARIIREGYLLTTGGATHSPWVRVYGSDEEGNWGYNETPAEWHVDVPGYSTCGSLKRNTNSLRGPRAPRLVPANGNAPTCTRCAAR